MKLLKIGLIVFCVLVLITGCLFGGKYWYEKRKVEKADELFRHFGTVLAEYPQLPEGYGYTSFYYTDGSTEYFLLENNGKTITAIRNSEGNVVYYLDGKAWQLVERGLAESGVSEDPVAPVVQTVIRQLLTDTDILYTYDVAHGPELPMWILSGARYLNCKRIDYPDCFEFMSCDTEEENGLIIWDLFRREGEDVILFLYMCESLQEPPEYGRGSIPGWGEIGEDIFSIVFAESKTRNGSREAG